MKRFRNAAVLFMLIALLLARCGNVGEAETENVGKDIAADETINVEAQQYWREEIQKYRDDDAVGQLLFVRYTGGARQRFFSMRKKGMITMRGHCFLRRKVLSGNMGLTKPEREMRKHRQVILVL